MLRFSDLNVGDYVLWGSQRSNIDGDYDIEFNVRRLTLADFAFMERNSWNERDLNEFVKPIEITHKIMVGFGFASEEVWAGIVQYFYRWEINKWIELEYSRLKVDSRDYVYVTMDKDRDVVRNMKADCFNVHGSFMVERTKKAGETHYVHELQHLFRECNIEFGFQFPEG